MEAGDVSDLNMVKDIEVVPNSDGSSRQFQLVGKGGQGADGVLAGVIEDGAASLVDGDHRVVVIASKEEELHLLVPKQRGEGRVEGHGWAWQASILHRVGGRRHGWHRGWTWQEEALHVNVAQRIVAAAAAKLPQHQINKPTGAHHKSIEL
jgi:hypothetical protein